ncbi:acid-sensing ion channel 1C-like [Diadema antillarum]|uniref:acid-sensing ion channel 1C-like n=1 Tax=Diadema antillarum TaxID=105358 RepID=UPI003A893210
MPAIVPTDSAGAAWSAESSGVSTVEKMSGLKKDSEVTYRKSNATMSQNRKRVLSTAAANEGVDEDELNAYLMIGSTLENTGAHGIPNIIRAKSPHRRILWAVLFLGGVGFFLWQGVTIIKKYYDYDVVVNLDIQYESTIDMPAITICNMNPITNSSLSTFSSELERLLVEDQTVATPPMPAGPTVAATRMRERGDKRQRLPNTETAMATKNKQTKIKKVAWSDSSRGSTKHLGGFRVLDYLKSSRAKSPDTRGGVISSQFDEAKDRQTITSDRGDEQEILFVVGSRIGAIGAHGLPNIYRATNPYRRGLWLAIFLAGLCVVLWQFTTLLIAYFKHDVNINTDFVRLRHLDFPAITVCNLNPIMASKLDELTEYGLNRDDIWPAETASSTQDLEGRSNNSSTRQSLSMRAEKYQDWENVDLTDQDDRVDKLEEAIDIIGSAPYDQRNETGHKLDDMLLSCYFQNFPCFPENFTHFYNYMYGNCFTFNSGSKGRVLNVSKIGPLYGLSLELYIDQSEYISTIQPSAGIRLLIHNQHEMPFPEDQGINLAPGAHTSVGLSLVDIERLGHPYTNCSLDFAEGNIFRDKFSHLDYSRSTCEKNCFFKGVLENCKCADPRYRYDNSIPVCNTSIPRIDECVDQIEENYTLGLIPCNCTMPCRQQNYHYTISEAHWPNDGYMDEVKEGIAEISDSLRRQLTQDPNFIEDNVVKVGVFYDNLQFQYIYQTPAYDWYSLVSDLGGQVGLWIGVSVLTIFEFVELVYDLFKLCFMKMMDPRLKKRSGASRNDVMSLDVKNAGSGEKNVVFSQGFQ